MALKRIGAFWENHHEKSKTRYSGKIDVGALGEIDVIMFENAKQGENHPDMTLHLITKDEPKSS